MRVSRTGIAALLAGLLWGSWAAAQDSLPKSPAKGPTILARAVRSGHLRFSVTSGRISIGGSRFGVNSASSASGNGWSERLAFRGARNAPSVSYELTTADARLSVEIASADRICIRRTAKGESKVAPVQFDQTPGGPISLVLGKDDKRQVYRAAGLWHLLLARPQQCRKHLLPILDMLRPGWKLDELADELEQDLLRKAAAGQLPDRRRWAALVEQLADDRFAKREAADRQLRSAGQIALSYLQGLDFNRLDAEQQFRVRRIITSMSRRSGDDTVEQVALLLVADPAVWLSLLSRPEPSIRRLAARQLAGLLDGRLSFDPAADEPTRKTQIEQLRRRIGGQRPR